MALVRSIHRIKKDTYRVHAEVSCDCSLFEEDGEWYVQLDTYGSKNRELPGKMSQSIQLDRKGAAALRAVLDEVLGHS